MRANGAPATLATERPATHHLSLTRSAGAKPRPVDAAAQRGGYAVKTHTTSQTLDILRTAVALRDPTDGTRLTDLPLSSFDLFHRRDQKAWDGVAGLCFGAAAGLHACAEDGSPFLLGPMVLSRSTPVFPSTVTGRPGTVSWFVDESASTP